MNAPTKTTSVTSSKKKTLAQRYFAKDCSLEHDQARTGVYLYFIAVIGGAYNAAFHIKDAISYAPLVFILFFSCAALLSCHTLAHQEYCFPRRIVKYSLDLGIFYFGFLNGYAGAWAFFGICSMAIGTGFRFGTKAMLSTIAQNALLMLLALYFVDYYRENIAVWFTIFIFFLVSTLYTSVVVSQLHAMKKRLSEMAMHDGLTGLPNRRLFIEHMMRHMLESRRKNAQVACFFMDLDGFKKVNDTLGHPVGDKLLIKVATVIKSKLRNTDICARLGGDEFVVVAACDSSPKDVLLVAERILHGIENIREIDDMPVKVSASIGIAYYASEAGRSGRPDPDRLLNAADLAMYSAKNGGKGRIVTSDKKIGDD